MNGWLPLALILAASLPACGGRLVSWHPDTYMVRSGDTVYSIAWRHGLDYRQLARWNGLDNSYLIHPGQRLVLKPPAGGSPRPSAAPTASIPSTPSPQAAAEPRPDWIWPTRGDVVAGFREGASARKGIDISGRLGQPIRAAAAGRVVYTGSGLIGYGKLIIIKHNKTYLSAYGHNNKVLVKEGDQVRSGQHIAAMGEGPGKRPVLHFEIRMNGRPVDPAGYLPAS